MEASREFSRTPRRLPPCSDVFILQITSMSHFWDTHHMALPQSLMAGQGRVTVRFFSPPPDRPSAGLRGDNYSRIYTPELFTVLMQTMDRQTIIMQRVHPVLVVAFHFLM